MIQTLGTWGVQPQEVKTRGHLTVGLRYLVEELEPSSSYRCAMAQEETDTFQDKSFLRGQYSGGI